MRILARIATFTCLTFLPIGAQNINPKALLRPPTDEWLTYHGEYNGQRHSTLTQITPQNVKNLSLAWAFQTNQPAEIKSSPLLVNGILYFTVPDNIWAIDARSGHQIWHYHYPPLLAVLAAPLADAPPGADRSGLLPFAVSVALWYVLSVGCLAAGVHALASALEPRAVVGGHQFRSAARHQPHRARIVGAGFRLHVVAECGLVELQALRQRRRQRGIASPTTPFAIRIFPRRHYARRREPR